jgi:hypothetical protein
MEELGSIYHENMTTKMFNSPYRSLQNIDITTLIGLGPSGRGTPAEITDAQNHLMQTSQYSCNVLHCKWGLVSTLIDFFVVYCRTRIVEETYSRDLNLSLSFAGRLYSSSSVFAARNEEVDCSGSR